MRIKKIKTNLTEVRSIIHCADIHIRNWKRHKEYRHIFKRFEEDIEKIVTDKTIITVGGDIAHAKTDMSPELVQMMQEFFTMLTSLAPTIIIAGNHDANLNNADRLDAISPVVRGLNDPNLHYLKDTGLYQVGDCIFSVFSVFDTPDKYIKATDIQGTYYKKIAMYHGTVGNSETDTGMRLSSGLDIKAFAGYDIGLLGDIHKRQVLKTNPLIFFPGSMVQQNFGESYTEHGYAVLNLEENTNYFVDLPNQYGYCTILVEDGQLPPQVELDGLNLTTNTSVRLKTKNTTPADLKRVMATLRKLYKIKPVAIQQLDKINSAMLADFAEYNNADVWNVEYQNKLLTQYFEDHHVDDETVSVILQLNKQLNGNLQNVEHARNVIWKPKRFEFSNMFSYGEDNVFDFTDKQGIYGLFAANHTGKSALLDAMCFCLFDESFRAVRADQVLNNTKTSFRCKFNFELDGINYYIERTSSMYKYGPLKGKQKVDVKFWYVDEAGVEVSLNGEQRRDTNKHIQSFIGTFDDFILTALSLQNNNSNFIDKTQSERKDLLANFLDLRVFDKLYEICSDDIKSTLTILKEYEKQDFQTMLGDSERKKEVLTKKYNAITKKVQAEQGKADKLNAQIVDFAGKMVQIEGAGLDPEDLARKHLAIANELSIQKDKLHAMQTNIDEETDTLNKLLNEHKKQDSKQLEAAYAEYGVKKQELDVVELELREHRQTVTHKLEKLKKLETHEYDPNCKYCVSNEFVKDAINTRDSLEQQKIEVNAVLNAKAVLTEYLTTNKPIVEAYESHRLQKQLIDKHTNSLKQKRQLQTNAQSKIATTEMQLDRIVDQQDLYNRNQQTIQRNNALKEKIAITKASYQEKLDEVVVLTAQQQDCYASLQVSVKEISDCEKSIKHMQELSEKAYAYDYYIKAISRDGIPYKLISKAVPYIETYVNSMLAQVSDFTLQLETDGKNINVFINYEDRKWPLELASGMEKFIASLAIRIALIKISNLPRPDFIAIDEGLGVLDSSNLNSMHMFFTNLKDLFNLTLIISHIDVVRDMVDKVITIDRKDGLSYINN